MIPAFLMGPLGGAAVVVAGGLAFFGWLNLIHDPNVRAEQVAAITAAVSAQQLLDAAAATAALEDQAAATAATVATRIVIRERIIRAPASSACAASPAIVAAVAGVRSLGAGDRPATGAAVPAVVPRPAHDP